MPELVAFADAFAHARKHGHAFVQRGHRVHELHDQHSLADTGTAEQAGLAAFHERAEQVDDLDTGLQYFTNADSVRQWQRRAVDIAENAGRQGTAVIQRLAEDIQQSPEAFGAHGHMERRARIVNRHAPVQPGAAVQGDRAQMVRVQVLMYLEQIGLVIQIGAQGLAQGRQRIAGNDHDRAMHFGDDAYRCLAVVFSGAGFRHIR